MSNPTAFISYSWDSASHREWVRNLAIQLQHDGVEVVLDQFDALPGDRLTQFMEDAISKTDFVLIICTPNYKQKADGRRGGVGYEGDIIASEVFANTSPRKFIPILREGEWFEAASIALRDRIYVDLRGTSYPEQNYQELLAALRGQGARTAILERVSNSSPHIVPAQSRERTEQLAHKHFAKLPLMLISGGLLAISIFLLMDQRPVSSVSGDDSGLGSSLRKVLAAICPNESPSCTIATADSLSERGETTRPEKIYTLFCGIDVREACTKLGTLYLSRPYKTQHTDSSWHERAVIAFDKSCDLQDWDACVEEGNLRLNSELNRAMNLWLQACRAKGALGRGGCYQLGMLYLRGTKSARGVEAVAPDTGTARDFFIEGCNVKGDSAACLEAGHLST
jgi:hypothetical protein